MTIQFAYSTLMPLLTFAIFAAVAWRLVERNLLSGRTRIAKPLLVFAALCELVVLIAGWMVLFDATGRFRGVPEGWMALIFTVVEPLGRLSALTGAAMMFFGVKRSAPQ